MGSVSAVGQLPYRLATPPLRTTAGFEPAMHCFSGNGEPGARPAYDGARDESFLSEINSH